MRITFSCVLLFAAFVHVPAALRAQHDADEELVFPMVSPDGQLFAYLEDSGPGNMSDEGYTRLIVRATRTGRVDRRLEIAGSTAPEETYDRRAQRAWRYLRQHRFRTMTYVGGIDTWPQPLDGSASQSAGPELSAVSRLVTRGQGGQRYVFVQRHDDGRFRLRHQGRTLVEGTLAIHIGDNCAENRDGDVTPRRISVWLAPNAHLLFVEYDWDEGLDGCGAEERRWFTWENTSSGL